jgi:hypothetical protein
MTPSDASLFMRDIGFEPVLVLALTEGRDPGHYLALPLFSKCSLGGTA